MNTECISCFSIPVIKNTKATHRRKFIWACGSKGLESICGGNGSRSRMGGLAS